MRNLITCLAYLFVSVADVSPQPFIFRLAAGWASLCICLSTLYLPCYWPYQNSYQRVGSKQSFLQEQQVMGPDMTTVSNDSTLPNNVPKLDNWVIFSIHLEQAIRAKGGHLTSTMACPTDACDYISISFSSTVILDLFKYIWNIK
jgi:hypothetical protein